MAELIRWPESAKVDRVIPKERFYAGARAGTALKHRLVDEVQRIRWGYKLGEESIHLKPGPTVTEIQIFVIDLKGATLDDWVLTSIDRAIPSHVIFELRRDDGLAAEQVMPAVTPRVGSKAKAADYARSGWVGSDLDRVPLPTALDMDGLHAQLLGRLLPYSIRPDEALSEALDRIGHIRALERKISALQRRMRNEPQFNRKVELRSELRVKQAELDDLITQPNRMIDTQRDAAWRS